MANAAKKCDMPLVNVVVTHAGEVMVFALPFASV
jgi:hypothetical protein